MTRDIIEVVVGARFTVQLGSTPTTGYVWEVDALPKGVELLGSDFAALPGEVRPGDSTTQVFQLRAVERGEHAVTFALGRGWQRTAIETRTVKVIAR